MKMARAGVEASTEQPTIDLGGIGHFLRLPLRVSERRLLLTGLDLLAINVALIMAMSLRQGHFLSPGLFLERRYWFIVLSLLWLPLAHAFDAYDLRVASRISTVVPAVLKTATATLLLYLFVPYLSPVLPDSRLSLFTLFLLSYAFLVGGRVTYIVALRRPLFHRRALIVGAGWAGQTIAQAILDHDDGTYKVFGFIDDDPAMSGSKLAVQTSNTRLPDAVTFDVLGDRNTLKDLVSRYRVTTLVLAITNQVDGELLQELIDCLELGVSIVPMPILYEQLTGRVPIEHVGSNWYVAMPISHASGGAMWPLIKRLMDIVLGLAGLAVLALITPVIALAMRMDSRGPLFYTQTRVGKGGRPYMMYKFRSMVADAEKGQAVWAQKNDSRVTRVGRLMRKTHIDEFPQFLNILKGEMSIVGPRPERPEFTEELAKEIPFYRVRHAIKPGAAGWGLIKQGYGASKQDALLKLQYDLYYIKHQSPWLDVIILIKTAIQIVTFRGR